VTALDILKDAYVRMKENEAAVSLKVFRFRE
jgi:hypothetical protein